MNAETEALLQKVLAELHTLLRHVNDEDRRAELKGQAKFIVEREKQEVGGNDN